MDSCSFRSRRLSLLGAILCVVLLFAGCASTLDRPRSDSGDQLLHDGPISSPLLQSARARTTDHPDDNYLALLEVGSDALLSRIHLIAAATRSIDIQTLIWANDEAGRLLMYELARAAQRGVKVRLLIDHLSSEQHIKVQDFLRYSRPNLAIKFFNPVTGLFSQPKARSLFVEKLYALIFKFHKFNHRMHNKTFVVDDLVAICGGRNYQNAYFDLSTGMNYKDRDVLATGPIVGQIAESFDDYWSSDFAVPLKDLHGKGGRDEPRGEERALAPELFMLNGLDAVVGSDAKDMDRIRSTFIDTLRRVEDAYFVADSPSKRDRFLLWATGQSLIVKELAKVVGSAKQSLVIQTPYLILTNRATRLFKRMRNEHPEIDIRISTNSLAATDSWHVYAFSYKQKQTYLQTLGFRIFEFKPRPEGMSQFMPDLLFERAGENGRSSSHQMATGEGPYLCLHSKSVVVDDEWSFVGSYNLDPRSENINTEAGLFVRDRDFSRLLKQHILRDMQAGNSWVVARKDRPLGLDAANSLLAKLSNLVPLVDIWPFRYSSSFELIEGHKEVAPEHPDFYRSFKDVGSFPGISLDNTGKEVGARGTKAFLGFVKPLL